MTLRKKIKFVDDNNKGLLVELKAVVFNVTEKYFLTYWGSI